MTPDPGHPNSNDRLRKRATAVIFAGAALGTTGLFAAFSLGPIVAVRITGSDGSAGLPGAAAVSGVAVGAFFLSAIMARRGRGPGLATGYGFGAIGAILVVLSIERSSFLIVLLGMSFIGVSHASNQLARFAAADIHPPEQRGVVLSWIVWAGTIGAILGPGSLEYLKAPTRALGLDPISGGFVAGGVLFAVALVACLLGLRGPAIRALAEEDESGGLIAAKAAILPMMRLPHARLALIVALASQMSMVAVMTMTPLHVRHAGVGLGSAGLVMSAHFAGMFGLAPLAGKFNARFGTIPVMLTGALMLVLAAMGAGTMPADAVILFMVPLLLLGIGWSLCFVAASALLTKGLGYRERARLQGSVDGIVWASSALASVGSGAIVAVFGFSQLCLIAATISLMAIVFTWSQRAVLAEEIA
jgi:MFS family permease